MKRERVVDIDLLAGDDHFADQTLYNRLALLERQLFEIIAQQLPKSFSMINDLLPVHRLLLGLSQLLTLPLQLLPLGLKLLAPTLQFAQADDLSLIGVE